jgi:hypothetical protein
MAEIKYGSWTPDKTPRESELITASNCVPVNGIYEQFLAASTSGAALAAVPLGAFHAIGPEGSAYVYAATGTGIYQAGSTSWTDKSRSGGYTVQADTIWRFTQYGNFVLAANLNEPMQIATIGGNFANIDAEFPRAKTLGVIRNFVVAGDIMALGGYQPHSIQWSAIDDPTDWPIPLTIDALSKQSGLQEMNARYGDVNFIGNGERFGTILQERGVSRAAYIGGNAVFQFDTFEKTHGAFTKGGNVQVDDTVYFLAEQGFFLTDGHQIKDIGYGKVNQTFIADFNKDERHQVTAAADTDNKVIYWSYCSTGQTTPDKIMAYSYAEDRWTVITQSVDLIFSGASLATTLEDLDASFADLEAVTPTMDSPVFAGAVPQVSVIYTDEKLGTFTGTALTAVLETGEFATHKGGRGMISEVHPVIEGGTVVASLGARNTASGTRRYTPASRVHRMTGWAPFTSNAKWHTIKLTISGGFTRADGVYFESVGTGT